MSMDDIVDNVEDPGQFNYDPNSPPTPEQLLAILDSIKGLSDEDREQLRSDLLQRQEAYADMHVAQQSMFTNQMFMLTTMLFILTLIFVFFGYKLYKSLTEKERKRDEKKKLKQQKKRK